ncbi:MAG: DUF2344 domain-containing protein [Caldilineales bacterium]|nr:DUF2344 domain-containing protein [Caldilineales bacterium]
MTPDTSPPAQRLRLRYAKKDHARFVGHLDEARFWERVFRRVDLPLAYSHGFNPQPRLQFAAALPVGVCGEQELLDLWLTTRVEPDLWRARIGQNLPAGFTIHALEEAALTLPAMQASLRQAEYQVAGLDPAELETLSQRVAALLAQSALPRPHHKHPGQTYDLRPLIHEITPVEGGLRLRLAAGAGGNARITEVLAALGLAPAHLHICRTALIFDEAK